MAENGILEQVKAENSFLREQVRTIQQQFENKVAELSMVREMGMVLLHLRNFEHACTYILDVIVKHTIARNCSLMVFDQERNSLFLVAASNAQHDLFVLDAKKFFSREGLIYSFSPGTGAAGKALKDHKAVLVHDAGECSYFSERTSSPIHIGSLLSVPLLVENEPFGIINLSHNDPHSFTQDDVYLFNIIADVVALSLSSIINYGRLLYSEEKHRLLAAELSEANKRLFASEQNLCAANQQLAAQFQEIRESRDFLENIFKTSADGILISGKHGIITMANDAMGKILGYPIEELIGKAFIEFQHPGDIYEKQGIELVTDLFEAGSVNCIERQYLHKNGKLIDVELSAALIRDPDGNITGSVAVFRDINERKKVEAEKKKLEEQLQRSEKMETIGLLAGGVAHDLNNMLGAIVGYPELLLTDLPLDSPLHRPIKAIKDSGDRAAAIVQDLLTLTRRGVAAHEIVNLNTIILNYFGSIEWEKLKEFHPTVTVQQCLDPDLMNIIGSPVHLLKVVANLVSNAAEAMPGGGNIEICTANRHMQTPLKGYDCIAEGAYALFSVADTGIGIEEADLQHIFEPFYTKKVMGRSGTGLGMSVVWGTVKDHNGYIDIVSKQGEGTTITLYFPATRQEFKKQEAPFLLQDYMGNGEAILVIDDVEPQRDIAKAILTKLRYKVETVASGEEAIEYLKTGTADLLVIDMIMAPGMDGLETYRKILGLHPHQKAVIASGYTETESVRQAQELGAGAYIKKPYTIEKLGRAVRNELHR